MPIILLKHLYISHDSTVYQCGVEVVETTKNNIMKTLMEMKYGSSNSSKTVWCLQDITAVNGEFTLCGTAYDSDIDFDGAESTGKTKNSGKITCKECLEKVKWIKSLRL